MSIQTAHGRVNKQAIIKQPTLARTTRTTATIQSSSTRMIDGHFTANLNILNPFTQSKYILLFFI